MVPEVMEVSKDNEERLITWAVGKISKVSVPVPFSVRSYALVDITDDGTFTGLTPPVNSNFSIPVSVRLLKLKSSPAANFNSLHHCHHSQIRLLNSHQNLTLMSIITVTGVDGYTWVNIY